MAKFDLPIQEFLLTKLRENFPTFDLREGTAFRDMLIKPMNILFQPLRDQTNIIKRNLTLENFALMLDDEFDLLVSNIFVTRRSGDQAVGSVRVLFDAPRDTVISTNVKFLTQDGLTFVPQETIVVTAEQMRLNVQGLFFFVDVPVIAESSGSIGSADAGTIIFAEGAPEGIVQVDNPNALIGGIDTETNTQLFGRAETSITVRDLVVSRSILAVILEEFTSIREALVQGFGDPEMERDLISILVSLSEVIGTQSTGATAVSTTFTDVTEDFVTALVAPGHELIIETGADAGTHIITGVTATTLVVSVAFTAAASGLTYRIRGFAVKEDLHIGGKVDVYADTTTLVQKDIVIDPVELVGPDGVVKVNRAVKDGAIIEGDDTLTVTDFDFLDDLVVDTDRIEILEGPNIGIYDIQTGTVTRKTVDLEQDAVASVLSEDDVVTWRILRHYYEVFEPFELPAVKPTRVVRLDPITREEVGIELIEGADFFIRVNNSDLRFSSVEDIEFVFDSTFVGTVMKIEYQTDTTVPALQSFLDDSTNRVVTADLLSRRALPAFVDMTISYTGDPEPADLEPIVRDFIDTVAFNEPLQQSDIIALIYSFSVNFVATGFTMTVRVSGVDGVITEETNDSQLTIPANAHFIADNVVLNKTGA